MRVTNKLIEQVVTEVAGEDTVPLVLAIKDKINVSEFKIAEMLDEQINITRNMLYRLLDQNLVHFIRKKDRQKGWYIYYWTFNVKQIRFLTIKLQKQRLDKIVERLDREKSAQFFHCPSGCIRLDFERAMNFEFKCPECGEIIQQKDNHEEIALLEGKIKEIEDFLAIESQPQILVAKEAAKEVAKELEKETARQAKQVKQEIAKKVAEKEAKKKAAKKKSDKKKATKKKAKDKEAKKKAVKKKSDQKKADKKKATEKADKKKATEKADKKKVTEKVAKKIKTKSIKESTTKSVKKSAVKKVAKDSVKNLRKTVTKAIKNISKKK